MYILEQEIYPCTITNSFFKGEMLIRIYQFSVFPVYEVARNKNKTKTKHQCFITKCFEKEHKVAMKLVLAKQET